MDPLAHRLLSLLDRWRHLPAYQLERRADVFFALWLEGVLEEHTGQAVDPRLVPELPVPKRLLGLEALGRESFNVDYLAVSRDRTCAWLVELKTDMRSRRDSQDQALARARELGWTALAGGIAEIFGSAGDRWRDRKYRHLVQALAELDLLTVPPDLDDYVDAENRRGLSARLAEIRAPERAPLLDVVYVQPHGSREEGVISFATFADHLDGLDDPDARCFADYLRRWAELEPGARS